MKVIKEFDLLDQKQREAHTLIEQSLSDGALEVQGTAQELAPVGDTGILRANTRTERLGPFTYAVVNDTFYVDWVEYGTGAYREATAPGPPGRDSPWVYYWPEQDRFVWTRGNYHQPFLRSSYERHYQGIKLDMAKALSTL